MGNMHINYCLKVARSVIYSIVMLAFIGLILLGIFAVNSLMARRK